MNASATCRNPAVIVIGGVVDLAPNLAASLDTVGMGTAVPATAGPDFLPDTSLQSA
ncbi:hypothetical protein ART_4059 [Arthrobacter sp. PAMC 25486]|nr:hypothetical protein ART_4059 [Arthrobacter sp. PAMC 25486]